MPKKATASIPERRKSKTRLGPAYQHDHLTGLPTRLYYDMRLGEALLRAKANGHVVAIIFLDLDGLKIVNHTFGHSMGDLLLQQVAKRLSSCVGEKGVLARLGGDEFLVFMEVQQAEQAEALAHRIIENLHMSFKCEDEELHVITHVGVSLYPTDGERLETLLRNADTALYRAKEEGKNNYQLYTPAMSTEAERRVILEHGFRRALKRREFILYYQPQVDMESGHIVGAEALVRWQHPEFGLVGPVDFIPIAEKTGLIIPMGQWVLERACEQTKAWQKAGLQRLSIAVNLSARQFQQQDMVKMIAQVLKQTRLDPNYLELEITESYAMQNADFTIAVLRDLKKMGVRVSIDDFGTGYSSLSYLKQFPIDTLKIDRSFVRDLSAVTSDAAIAEAVIALAHSLKLVVVAEGVETREQLAILKRHGCDRMQGYLFSPPVPADQFEKLIKERRTLPRFE
jgi:diguanylate cyclase (GGDEF)-like protein